ncbi:DUF2637 domain-containing protein [Actinomadura hibisca]|uniref:DUF2637 domain-containing protein n=1 Tax=Actinomadura hibisca TaxID=68565 RepID=UPI00082EC9E9|nr:DUF2637 domain-containing protein [Actinomadura hibisca]
MPADPTGPTTPSRHGTAQRRFLGAATGLVVLVLAAGAFAVSYDALRDLAAAGGVDRRWGPAYPVMADALLVIVVLALIVARHARWWTRAVRWVLLAALVAGGAALGVQHAVWGYASLPDEGVRAGVAVAPHAMLILAVWLWLTMFKQLRAPQPRPAEEPAVEEGEAASEDDAEAVTERVRTADVEQEAADDTVPVKALEAPRPPALLPTDVELVHRPTDAEDTDDDLDAPAVDRAEDPDAGDDDEPAGRRRLRRRSRATDSETTDPNGFTPPDDDDLPIWDWNPPSGSLRSSPTPPAE